MDRFLSANPGLRGRFGHRIVFADYSDAECLEILDRLCEQSDYVLASEARTEAERVITAARQQLAADFDNERMVRRLLEGATQQQAARLAAKTKGLSELSGDELSEIVADDIPPASAITLTAAD